VEDMARLTAIAERGAFRGAFRTSRAQDGSFAAQQFVINNSSLIDGLALSGSGALDGLVRLAQSGKRTPAEIVNAAFEPARTPYDWLSRAPATVDAFVKDPLCFGWLQPSATESLFAAAPRLADRARLLQISHISYDFYPGGRHEMLNEINQ
jgi:alpha-beta hydrolase superfamily lysophospholipase